MLLETFFDKGELNQMMFLTQFLDNFTFVFIFAIWWSVLKFCSYTQIDLRYFDSVLDASWKISGLLKTLNNLVSIDIGSCLGIFAG